ncbi:hypothetical protein Tco_1275896 [Tanacetum coccineum]
MRVFVKNQSTTIYSTGWSMKYVKSLTDEQLIAEFEKIRMAVADLKSQELRRTLKRAGEALEPDTLKKQKSTEAPIPSVPDVPQPPVVSSPKSSGTRRKSLLAGLPNILPLREILHMVDRHDLLKLYGLVVKYYENHHVAGAGLIRSWRLVELFQCSSLGNCSGGGVVHVCRCYLISLSEAPWKGCKSTSWRLQDVVGNDLNYAEHLIRFIKNQIADALSFSCMIMGGSWGDSDGLFMWCGGDDDDVMMRVAAAGSVVSGGSVLGHESGVLEAHIR